MHVLPTPDVVRSEQRTISHCSTGIADDYHFGINGRDLPWLINLHRVWPGTLYTLSLRGFLFFPGSGVR